MAMFKHDAQGFLVGELIETSRDMLKAQAQGMSIWKAIRTDVKAIAGAVGVQVATTVRTSRPGAVTPTRTSGGNYVATPGRNSGSSTGQRTAAVTTSRSGARTTVVVALPQRAVNGRFIAGQKRGGVAGDNFQASPGGVGGQSFSKLSDSIGKLSATMAAADNIDPTLNAAKEIKDVVSPLGRGLFSLFGRTAERRKERWYQRIINALKPGGNKSSSGTTGGGGGGGFMGGLGGVLRNVPSILMMVFTRILATVAALWGSFELGKWVGGKIYDWLDSSGILPKVFDAFDAIGNTVTKTWGKIASGADAVWSYMSDTFKKGVDSLLSLPDKVGQMLSFIDDSVRKIPGIGAAYAETVDAAKGMAESVKTDAKTGFNEGKTGDVSGKSTSLVQAVARDAGSIVSASSAVADQAKAGYNGSDAPSPSNMAQRAARAAGSAVGTTGVGISKILQTGAGFNVTQNTDGSVTRQDGARNWRNNNPGNIEAGDFATKHGAIGSDGRFAIFPDYATGRAAKEVLIFDSKNYKDKSLTDAIARYAPPSENNTAAYQTAALGAVGGRNKKMSDFAPAERTALMDAIEKSEGYRVGKLSVIPAGMFASFGAIATPNLPPVPSASVPASVPVKIPPAPEMPAPAQKLNSDSDSGRGIVVNVPSQFGQNVGDRGIAHIVSGGLGVR